MGIYCEIDTHTPPCGFFVPDRPVTGVLRYTLDEGTYVENIILSLKGVGNQIVIKDHYQKTEKKYYCDEEYVYITSVIKIDENENVSGARKYETEFNFPLPTDIPSSLEYKEEQGDFVVSSKISYNIRAKFIVQGRFSFNKKFTKEIQVASTAITPTLPMIPNIYGQRKKLFQPFTKGQSIVDIKAIVQSSVVLPGGKLEIAYEVQNDTNLVVKAIKTKLVEIYDFFYDKYYPMCQMTHNVTDLDSKTSAVKSRDTFKSAVEIMLPFELHNMVHSQLVKRSYVFLITAKLPSPHRDVKLEIPLEIGNPVHIEDISNDRPQIVYPTTEDCVSDKNASMGAAGTSCGPPPSYWQSIEERDSLSLVEDFGKKVDLGSDEEDNDSNETNATTSKKGLTR